MVSDIAIRAMRFDDLERVTTIDEMSFSMPWPPHAYYKEMEKSYSLTRVAEITFMSGSQYVAGMMVTWVVMDEAHIATLAVDPEYRRLGIARRLLADTLKLCIQQGVRVVTLEVRVSNQAAQVLYRSFKFEEVARRKGYYMDNHEDALIMNVYDLNEDYLAWITDHILKMNHGWIHKVDSYREDAKDIKEEKCGF
ncbi:MAG: ribosomal protein S18-alanine N-acetyltransferase [Anaerolineales bacterium]|nr:ribosomal protein S18-alanine N-acetyltransferase [Anaerolineales bacterium]